MSSEEELQITSSEEELQITSSEEELQITSSEEELQITSREEELQITSREEELQITSREEELQITSREEELQITSREEELQITSREEELQITSSEEELQITSREEELQITSREEELQITSREEELDVTSSEEELHIRPFDVVSGKGFLQVAQTLINIGAKYGAVDADAIIPHRQTVCDRTKQKAAAGKEKLSEEIQKVLEHSGIVVTTDMRTDEFNKRAYTDLSCHYIDEKWPLESCVLATVEFDSNLKKNVSDQGPNIKAALWTYHWVPCSAHTLNTVLRHTLSERNAPEGIKDVLEMIDTCKSLVMFLKRTSAVASLTHTVIQECEVRWNSKVDMMESIQKQYSDIRQLLEDKGQLLQIEGIFQDQLTHSIEFFTLFNLYINELEGEKYPTIHMVLL
ncbi:hypothetical protein E1301_Tti016010 [Triplophysa tibetana]|uniref:Hermes trasposase DNA-binding domain-containing protein n=1 Tax=Triplophysa tibetana TaxID=1572043 RepID=A0A5A9PC82_9TELE|nr:hypothetical protein E1301_Tti016010 [Triplophysa tibetana]